ncbi:diazepam binding inhibitor [Thecamonas trahens ATCC 50062]|uniref:Diazepam binding inhibitor n=1 Tax=Thecamonas trahens ATCC 50062 TaxID=461836 RepID=A0A0L0DI54_THETB|nr:diazepam binding inhibitor [Thecamonas trahens ATCC 50062]KNC50983.1 diazepam binding inhibitor [Thecamonas trahens ATCC 50062]|eukprot:XP_013756454.1 diazepam binding inhibitor [Thecamonas trahens ATCC 50062]
MAADLATRFNAVVEEVRNGPAVEASDDDKLVLYGLFKQATVGDADPKDKPGMLQAYSAKGYKWSAWNKNKGMSKDDAMQAYIDKVEAMRA